jgi:hypothetical protein
MASTKDMDSNCHELGTLLRTHDAPTYATLGNALINGTTTLQSLHRLADAAGLTIKVGVTPK